MAEKNLIKIYVNATSAKRVDIIIRHYTDFMGIVDGYREGLRYVIECEKEGKVTHIPTAEALENDYICLQDAADLLGISREKLAKIARSEEIGRLLDSTICNNKRWITRKSFQLFLNAQNVYYILDDRDEQEKSQMLQEKDTVSLEIKEYISRQEAAELAGVSVSTVTKWMQSGEFQCVGAGKVLRVHRQQFLNWLNEHREGVI